MEVSETSAMVKVKRCEKPKVMFGSLSKPVPTPRSTPKSTSTKTRTSIDTIEEEAPLTPKEAELQEMVC